MERYFYTQVTQEELDRCDWETDVKNLRICNENQFMDVITNEQWNKLENALSIGDVLYITSIAAISLDAIDFTQKMKVLHKKKIQLCDLSDRAYHLDETIEILEFLNTRARYMTKKKQMEGIERSLEKKKNGEGRYGRPRIKLPDDFEEHLRVITKEKLSLENYRRQLDIKKSTFYKLVREIRNSW